MRIKSREVLESFQQTWKFHNPLQDFQLDCAERTATVVAVGFYFGGDELYSLLEIPGTWHESCLEPANE